MTGEPQHAVIITKPGYPTIQIGPYWSRLDAGRVADVLRRTPATQRPAGTTIGVDDFYPVFTGHTIDPVMPTQPHVLGPLIQAVIDYKGLKSGIDEPGDGSGAGFPGLFVRLLAQEGQQRATAIWADARRWIDGNLVALVAHEQRISQASKELDRLISDGIQGSERARVLVDELRGADAEGFGGVLGRDLAALIADAGRALRAAELFVETLKRHGDGA